MREWEERRDLWTVSVAAFVTTRSELILVRNGDLWGLPAGGLLSGETPLGGVVREIEEESGLSPHNLLFQEGSSTGILKPLILQSFSSGRNQLGLVVGCEYHGRRLPSGGWPIKERKVSYAKPFNRNELRKLIYHPEEIYKPEFNFQALLYWVVNQGRTTKVVDRFIRKLRERGVEGFVYDEGKVGGSCFEQPSWKYIPPSSLFLHDPKDLHRMRAGNF